MLIIILNHQTNAQLKTYSTSTNVGYFDDCSAACFFYLIYCKPRSVSSTWLEKSQNSKPRGDSWDKVMLHLTASLTHSMAQEACVQRRENDFPKVMQWVYSKTRSSSWVILTSPRALHICPPSRLGKERWLLVTTQGPDPVEGEEDPSTWYVVEGWLRQSFLYVALHRLGETKPLAHAEQFSCYLSKM